MRPHRPFTLTHSEVLIGNIKNYNPQKLLWISFDLAVIAEDMYLVTIRIFSWTPTFITHHTKKYEKLNSTFHDITQHYGTSYCMLQLSWQALPDAIFVACYTKLLQRI